MAAARTLKRCSNDCIATGKGGGSRTLNITPSYVAVNEAGKPYQPDVLCQRIAQFIAVQGLPPISLHGLRHSFASVANSQNVPMFSISKALGHSSTSVTSAVYMHLFDDAVADVVSQVASAITGAEP